VGDNLFLGVNPAAAVGVDQRFAFVRGVQGVQVALHQVRCRAQRAPLPAVPHAEVNAHLIDSEQLRGLTRQLQHIETERLAR
jgi:hypothetical protein